MRQVLIPQQFDDLPSELPRGNVVTLDGQTMGTTWSVHYVDSSQLSAAEVNQVVTRALDQVVQQMSTWLPDSDISRFNQAAPGTALTLPAEFASVLSTALAVASLTDGCFDPTVGRLVDIWGFGPQGAAPAFPDEAQVQRALAESGWQKLRYDAAQRILVQTGRLALDFSGIAKGYGVDQVARALQQSGVQHYLVEVGGEFYGTGMKPDGQPWWVALERTRETHEVDEYIVALHGLGLATSGDYRRYFEHEGRRYAHTINPATGWPVEAAPVSVSVLAESCMKADAWATALTVMGLQHGLDFASAQGWAALFTVRTETGVQQHATPKLQEMLQ